MEGLAGHVGCLVGREIDDRRGDVVGLAQPSGRDRLQEPLALRRLEIDPALSAGVIITTFTDCIGFATLLGLGAIFLT